MAKEIEPIVGANVPLAVVVDATILETLRTVSSMWTAYKLQQGGEERAEELVRLLARALRLQIGVRGEGDLRVAATMTLEPIETTRARLEEIDFARSQARLRAAEIERRVKASLPEL
jgi:hypothetical protein